MTRSRAADISIFHEFKRPPYGGGNQFLLALRSELLRRELQVETNTISSRSRACLFNSFNFDFARLRTLRRSECRMVHRVDGPVGIYRGRDDGTDARIRAINDELADTTVFQSRYSLERHLELGLTFKDPSVITNAVDPRIFHPPAEPEPLASRRVRLIATAWSDNPNKGASVYSWLEDHLDWDRFDFTFVGRSPIRFKRIRMLSPLPSEALADVLREHDVFITASKHESCSNALIEALACGLPALYVRSGGHPEIVGNAGLGFEAPEELPMLLNQLVAEYEVHRGSISVPSLTDVADRYLVKMGFDRRA